MLFFRKITFFVPLLWRFWVSSKNSLTFCMYGNTPLGNRSRNLCYYIAEVHPSVTHRCTPSSDTAPYNLLQYLIKSVLCLLRGHDVIKKESLNSDYLSPYRANLIVSSGTLLNNIPHLRISMNNEQTRIGLPVSRRFVTLITVGVHKAYSNKITWLTEPTPYLKTLQKRDFLWWKQENLPNCKRNTLKIWRAVKYSSLNLTRA